MSVQKNSKIIIAVAALAAVCLLPRGAYSQVSSNSNFMSISFTNYVGRATLSYFPAMVTFCNYVSGSGFDYTTFGSV